MSRWCSAQNILPAIHIQNRVCSLGGGRNPQFSPHFCPSTLPFYIKGTNKDFKFLAGSRDETAVSGIDITRRKLKNTNKTVPVSLNKEGNMKTSYLSELYHESSQFGVSIQCSIMDKMIN